MMASETSSPASAFTKVLRSFETGGFTYPDVEIELKRLLKAGASPIEMSEILRRRESVEPLPVDARKAVLGLLDAAAARAGAGAGDQPAAPSAVRPQGAAKASVHRAPAPPIPEPTPIPESKLVTVPVQLPAAKRSHGADGPGNADGPGSADGPGHVVARAITLARTSASPARASASPDSVRRRARRMAPAARALPVATRAASPQRTLREHPAPLKARVIGWSAAALAMAAAAWLYASYGPPPSKPAVPPVAAPVPGTLRP